MPMLSSARARLSGFDHAYAVAAQRLAATGQDQYIVRTTCSLQSFQVTSVPPRDRATVLAMVLRCP